MQNLVINNQAVNLQSIMDDVRTSVEKGFKGFGNFTPEAVMEMLTMISNTAVVADSNVPKDYLQPNWQGKNRVYEWKNHIPKEQQAIWESLTDRQKMVYAKTAHQKAMAESWD